MNCKLLRTEVKNINKKTTTKEIAKRQTAEVEIKYTVKEIAQ